MKLEVLLHFLEQYPETSSPLIKECSFFSRYIKVVSQKNIVTIPLILITDPSKLKCGCGSGVPSSVQTGDSQTCR
jgi:hypothetical protein